MLRVMVTGSRKWNKTYDLSVHLTQFLKSQDVTKENVKFILGDAAGVDAIARTYCDCWGISYHLHVAHWNQLGKKAGALRNRAMVNDTLSGPMDDTRICLAFLQEGAGNVGTTMAMTMAKEAGIEVRQYLSTSTL